MKSGKPTIEQFAYVLIFLLALALRLFRLGELPLSDSEATLALQSLDLSRGIKMGVIGQPAYVNLTSILFFIFGSTSFLARLIPALSGSLIILFPYTFREKIGRLAALVVAFGLAIDPGYLGIARQADGFSMALVFPLLGLVFLCLRKEIGLGICIALSFLVGQSAWMGLFILMGVVIIERVVRKNRITNEQNDAEALFSLEPWKDISWKNLIVSALVTIFTVGTLFWFSPAGLSAASEGLVNFVRGFSVPSGTVWQELLGTLLGYQTPILILVLIATIRAFVKQDATDIAFFFWMCIAFLIVSLYPGHKTADIAWMSIPLWCLAGRQVIRIFANISGDEGLPILGQAVLTVILLVFAWLNLLWMLNTQTGNVEPQLRMMGMIGALALLVIISGLIAWGWSFSIAGKGAGIGIVALFFIFTFAAGWNAAGLGRAPASELWRMSPLPVGADLMLKTVEDFSEWNTGEQTRLYLKIEETEYPSLTWLLRRMNQSEPDVTNANSPLVITDAQTTLSRPVAYTGQDFSWNSKPSWSLMFINEWLRWVAFREAPFDTDTLILWVRSDLFPAMKTSGLE